jgi:GT2 family glycosyltransferase
MHSNPVIGVVIVVYNSADVILDCLESLFSQEGLDLRVVVVDNASPDDSVDRIRAWA